jgi:dihydroorotase
MISELLRQVRVLDPVSQTDRIADVLIVDGVVRAMEAAIAESDLPEATQIRDGTGLVLGPGLVDLYSHSGEPGFESRETLISLMQGAIAGGFTRLLLLPDTDPPMDHTAGVEWLRTRVQQIQQQSQSEAWPTLQAWGALTVGVKGQQMVELAELAEANIVGFADGQPLANWQLIRRILEYGQPLGQPIALWCCDRDITGSGIVREGSEALRLGLPGSPVMAETVPLAALLECVAEVGVPVHLMRISTARSVELIDAAKQKGLPITASTTWMHLLLNIYQVQGYDPSLHLEPPLGNPEDQQALIQAVQAGTIDAIAIDHSPYTYEEKTVAFAEAPAGAIGLELALPLLWQTFVASHTWDALTLWRALSTHPAQCVQVAPPAIAVGQAAELTLFDPQATWTVTAQSLHSLAINTPWLGQTLTGRVLRVWNAGKG